MPSKLFRYKQKNVRKLEIKVVGGYFVGDKSTPSSQLSTPILEDSPPISPISDPSSPITPSIDQPLFSFAKLAGSPPTQQPGDLKQLSVDPTEFLPDNADVHPGSLFVGGTLNGVVDDTQRAGRVRFVPKIRNITPPESISAEYDEHSDEEKLWADSPPIYKRHGLVSVISWVRSRIQASRDRKREEDRIALIADESFEAGYLTPNDFIELAQQDGRQREWERELEVLPSLPTTESWLASRDREDTPPPPLPTPISTRRLSRAVVLNSVARLSSLIGLDSIHKPTPNARSVSKASTAATIYSPKSGLQGSSSSSCFSVSKATLVDQRKSFIAGSFCIPAASKEGSVSFGVSPATPILPSSESIQPSLSSVSTASSQSSRSNELYTRTSANSMASMHLVPPVSMLTVNTLTASNTRRFSTIPKSAAVEKRSPPRPHARAYFVSQRPLVFSSTTPSNLMRSSSISATIGSHHQKSNDLRETHYRRRSVPATPLSSTSAAYCVHPSRRF